MSDKPFVSLLGGVAIGGWSGVDGLPVNAFATIKVSIDQWELSFRWSPAKLSAYSNGDKSGPNAHGQEGCCQMWLTGRTLSFALAFILSLPPLSLSLSTLTPLPTLTEIEAYSACTLAASKLISYKAMFYTTGH